MISPPFEFVLSADLRYYLFPNFRGVTITITITMYFLTLEIFAKSFQFSFHFIISFIGNKRSLLVLKEKKRRIRNQCWNLNPPQMGVAKLKKNYEIHFLFKFKENIFTVDITAHTKMILKFAFWFINALANIFSFTHFWNFKYHKVFGFLT